MYKRQRVDEATVNRNDKVYAIAWTFPYCDKIYKSKIKLNFFEACAALGAVEVTDKLIQALVADKGGFCEELQTALTSTELIGIYADSQQDAKVLALAFGDLESPCVHGSGMYAHYHANAFDGEHIAHIWFGGKLRY